jgi:4'-phosphopantetheinyl transferase
MLAIAYRNLVQGPTGSGNNIDRAVRAAVAHAHRSARRRVQRSATESLLGDLLECMSGRPSSCWQVTRNQDGKPTLVTSDNQSAIDVSLSHSGPRTLAGITDLGKIGVDLEHRAPRRSISEIAAYAFGPLEQRVVESGGPGAFYRIWTLREALAKACGIGFPMLTDGHDYFPEALNSDSWQTAIDGRQWLFSTGDLPDDYAFSVAIALRSPLHAYSGADLTPREFFR